MQSENCNGYPNKTIAGCSGSLQRTSTRILLRPSDGKEVVGSFVEYTEYEALSMQLPPKKRKLTDKTEHARSKDKSGTTDIRNFFTSTRKKTNSVQRNDVNVIELD